MSLGLLVHDHADDLRIIALLDERAGLVEFGLEVGQTVRCALAVGVAEDSLERLHDVARELGQGNLLGGWVGREGFVHGLFQCKKHLRKHSR